MAMTTHEGLHYWAPVRKLGGGWVCFKDSPAAPQAPDPVATAAAQTQSNIAAANAQAAINRSNQYTPWGSQTWQQTGTNPDGSTQWSSNISLAPAQQSLLDSSNHISQLLANLGINQAGNVASAVANPIDYNKFAQVQNPSLQNSVPTQSVGTTSAQGGNIQTEINGGQIQNGVAMPWLQRSISSGGPIQGAVQNSGQIQGSLGQAGNIRNNIAGAGNIQNGIDTNGTESYTRDVNGGGLQRGIDMSGVPQLVGGDALRGAMQNSQDAAYRQQASYLDPQYAQRQHDLENQLVQQGVTQNSDAWNRAMDELGRQRTFDYNNAFNNSFSQGLAANNQLFNQGLSTNQNAYGQALNNGQFFNNAQAQSFSQGLANANLNNAASSQLAAQRLAQMQAANAAQGQRYGENANDAAFANSAQAQQFGQALQGGQFANAAQAQRYSQNANDMTQANAAQAQGFNQNLAQGQFANSAAGQQFNQNLAQGQFANSAAAQQLAQNLAQGQFGNAAQAQQFAQNANSADRAYAQNAGNADRAFSQGLANAGLANSAAQQGFGQSMALRQQQINEALQQQQTPLNILNALRSGSQVSAPQFGSTPQGVVAPTDVAGLYNQQYQGQLGAYNAQIAQNNSITSGLGTLGAAALMSPAGTFAPLMAMFSDRRLKTNIRLIGTHRLGIGLYAYDYVWGEPGVGVMADELEKVMPEAVLTHPSGYKMVNYGVL